MDLSAQRDSVWSASFVLYHTKDVDIINQNPLNNTIGSFQAAKGNHTIVAYLGHKSNYSISGVQYGLDYYKKASSGYYHVGIKSSNAIFYPSISLEANFYKTVAKGVELGVGHKYLSYETGVNSNATRGSAVIYKGKWMLSYRVTCLDLSNLYHYGAARFWITDNDFFIEANIANSGETISDRSQDELSVSSISYGLKLGLPISDRTNFFAACNKVYTSQLKSNQSINAITAGVKIKI